MRSTVRVTVLGLPALVLLAACGTDAGEAGIVDPAFTDASPAATSSVSSWSEPQNIGAPINTPFNEQQSALSKDGLSLYFMSNRPEAADDAILDNNIWVATRACLDCPWEVPASLGAPVNGPDNDANPALSRDEHHLFLTSNRPGSQGNDIWVAYRRDVHDDFGWGVPVNLGPAINGATNEASPSYFENDGAGAPQLYFSRQVGPGGVASGDIHVSELGSDGMWSTAVPVVELNSDAADQRPSIRYDGLEIYFWSGRDAGRGVLGDGYIWHSTRERVDDAWSAPRLAPDPINAVSAIHPHIHSHGRVETLIVARNLGFPGLQLDLYVSTRTRGRAR